jgi:hypothetical protein
MNPEPVLSDVLRDIKSMHKRECRECGSRDTRIVKERE